LGQETWFVESTDALRALEWFQRFVHLLGHIETRLLLRSLPGDDMVANQLLTGRENQ